MSVYAICPFTVVPVRTSAAHRSEMGSQLLFGEMVEIMETKGRQWTKVRCLNDDYIGWTPSNQLRDLSPTETQDFRRNFAYSLDLFHNLMGTDEALPITLGSRLPFFDGMRFSLGTHDFTFSGQAVFPEDIRQSSAMVIKIARKLLNAPFLWGGRTVFGIDSPALVQLSFQVAGYQLPRTAEIQINRGETVDFVEQAMPGDIAFFENTQGRITHSGILLPDSKIIHVNEKVRIDAIDHYGIFNYQEGKYTHRLRVVKRIFAPDKNLPPVVLPKKEEQPVNQQALF
ncbi:NlpC/P60 family protein [Lewinella cohaerens]|uniref:C40 family peptidase n=1 Tax=Lewinella cohaerens TaxID=70995 RepID=UPI000379C76D|nr:NlpC/P60 family protein [Lewinella cohaerens]